MAEAFIGAMILLFFFRGIDPKKLMFVSFIS